MNDPRAERFDQALDALLAGGPATGEFRDLLELCLPLRDLPSLERKPMITATKTVTPYIHVSDPEKFKQFVKAAFGPETLHLINFGGPASDGQDIRAALHYFVEDVDAAYVQALAAGATVLMGKNGEPADRPYGERSAFVEDPWGNQWFLSKRLQPDGSRPGDLMSYLYPKDARGLMKFLEEAFGAQSLAVYEGEGRVMHAVSGFGDSTVEMGENPDGYPQALYLRVDDPQAALARAVAAGGVRLSEHAPGVRDPYGNHWYLV